MTPRHRPSRSTRTGLAAAVALAAALGLSSCGVLPDRARTDSSAGTAVASTPSGAQTGADEGTQPAEGGATEQPGTGQVLGSAQGQHASGPLDPEQVPLRLDVRSVRRVDGDAVEVRFAITNLHEEYVYGPWSTLADDTVASGAGYDVGGAALVDLAGDRRYLTLIDSADVCLCTTFPQSGETVVEPGRTLELSAQFPAPPESTSTVDFTLPGFAAVAGLEIG